MSNLEVVTNSSFARDLSPIPEVHSVEVKVSTDPQNRTSARVGAMLMNAAILEKHREYRLALNILRAAANLDSKNPVVLDRLAQVLEKVGKTNESLRVREILFKISGKLEHAVSLAHLYYSLHQDEKAKEMYFESLVRITESFDGVFEIYKNLGNIFVRSGDFEGAEEYYNKAYTLNSQSDALLVNYGTLDIQRQDIDRALECYRQAVHINPRNDRAWVGLAMIHRSLGDLELSWANIETALDINPRNRTAVHLSAQWATQDQRLPQAIHLLKNYLGMVEADSDMSLVLINLFCMVNEFQLAWLESERLIQFNPEMEDVHRLREKLRKLNG